MTPEALAALHARCFQSPPPWSAQAFADVLASAHGFLIAHPAQTAFVVGRVVADEAELLTLATAPEQRRKGLGQLLLGQFEDAARARGATTAFLEVSASNAPARALYARSGYIQTGRRRAYYRQEDGTAEDALILCKSLG